MRRSHSTQADAHAANNAAKRRSFLPPLLNDSSNKSANPLLKPFKPPTFKRPQPSASPPDAAAATPPDPPAAASTDVQGPAGSNTTATPQHQQAATRPTTQLTTSKLKPPFTSTISRLPHPVHKKHAQADEAKKQQPTALPTGRAEKRSEAAQTPAHQQQSHTNPPATTATAEMKPRSAWLLPFDHHFSSGSSCSLPSNLDDPCATTPADEITSSTAQLPVTALASAAALPPSLVLSPAKHVPSSSSGRVQQVTKPAEVKGGKQPATPQHTPAAADQCPLLPEVQGLPSLSHAQQPPSLLPSLLDADCFCCEGETRQCILAAQHVKPFLNCLLSQICKDRAPFNSPSIAAIDHIVSQLSFHRNTHRSWIFSQAFTHQCPLPGLPRISPANGNPSAPLPAVSSAFFKASSHSRGGSRPSCAAYSCQDFTRDKPRCFG